jgi:hypothetical protein
MPTKIETEMHLKDGEKGPFYMGNIRFPGTVEMHDLVVFFYPDTMKLQMESRRDRDGDPRRERKK